MERRDQSVMEEQEIAREVARLVLDMPRYEWSRIKNAIDRAFEDKARRVVLGNEDEEKVLWWAEHQ